MLPRRDDSLDSLLPSFREAVVKLVGQMSAAGYPAIVWETGRSLARAQALNKTGRGITLSMHSYGAAADILCKRHHWDCAEHGCDFYEVLADKAEALGLTSGHRWKKVDSVHVQALPVGHQAQFRKLKPEQRDAFVRPFIRMPRSK